MGAFAPIPGVGANPIALDRTKGSADLLTIKACRDAAATKHGQAVTYRDMTISKTSRAEYDDIIGQYTAVLGTCDGLIARRP